MTRDEIEQVLDTRARWMAGGSAGRRAYPRRAPLSGANLRRASLSGANLSGLEMRYVDLYGASLSGARLHDVDLHGADIRGAHLSGANIDYASWPLWCGSLGVHIDDAITSQLLYHVLSCVECSEDVSEEVKRVLLREDVVRIANRFLERHSELCDPIPVSVQITVRRKESADDAR